MNPTPKPAVPPRATSPRRTFGRTREEVRATSIAQKLVDALAEIEVFPGDPDTIFDAALIVGPSRLKLPAVQLHEVRGLIEAMKDKIDGKESGK